MPASQPGPGRASDEFDLMRSEQYRFLSRLLANPPDAATLEGISNLRGDATAMGQAYAALARAAAQSSAAQVEREYFELFIGVGRGELLPYASFYLTGFLNERPLAELRGELKRLGIARAQGRHEPEDHIALLFEVMGQMAAGELSVAPADQAAFFRRHVAPWAGQCMDDLAVAPSANFYRPLAEIGRLLVDIEARAFALAA
ncbi:TorD/DmsD family molecular chaperone [Pararhodobacter sp.]|uniref:TorD/DmsD family molecular chaperone n=1 Tax=Pararhodobacter sp. TaxID=2127056 RepID=UPI002FDCF2DF